MSGARLPPEAGTNDQVAAMLILNHIVEFMHTYSDLVAQGIVFHLAFESNMSQSKVGAICHFMQENTRAAAGQYANHLNVDYNGARANPNGPAPFTNLPANFIDMIRVYHDFDRVVKSTNLNDVVFKNGGEGGEVARLIDRDPAALEYALCGMYTTHDIKNEGFATLDMNLIRELITVHPKFFTTSAVETTDEFLDYMFKQMNGCMKQQSKKNSLTTGQGFKFGKGAKPGEKDDAVTLLALGCCLALRMKMLLLLGYENQAEQVHRYF